MKRFLYFNRIIYYFRLLISNIKRDNKNEYLKIKRSKINFEVLKIVFLIFICIIYYFLSDDFKNSIILFLFLTNIVIYFMTYNLKKEIFEYTDIKFNLEKSRQIEEKNNLFHKKNMVNRLICLDEFGNDKQIYELVMDEYIIGKSSLNNVVDIDLSDYKNEELVSRRQARVYKKNLKLYIVDEGSKNGTNIIKRNRRKINLIQNQEQILNKGDIIEISKIKILVN